MSLLAWSLAWLACAPSPADDDGEDGGGVTPVTDRADGDITPLAAGCDPVDPIRCWLPWPSSASTRLDATSATGLRVDVDEASLPVDDDPRWLELADGFSRLSPAMTAFPGELDPATADGAVRFFVAWEDGARAAREVSAWAEATSEPAASLVIGYPRAPLPADAEVVAIVTDTLRTIDGVSPTRSRVDAVALGLASPESDDEEQVRAWYAPVRRTLADAGVDVSHVSRAWSFHTRSLDDPGRRAAAMLADVDAADLDVRIDRVETRDGNPIAAVVWGEVTGVPDYRPDDGEWLTLDADGRPSALGTHGAPFRVVVPGGTGDYPTVLYGHGTGGDVSDSLFDADIAARGLAKAGMQFWGWNGDELLDQALYFTAILDGSTRSTSALLQSVADGHALVRALQGPLGDALEAEELGGAANPVAGRRPIADAPMWVGGSLGGTMGAVIVAADPDISVGILNVPGGAWTHFIPSASLYTLLVDPLAHAWYPSDLDVRAALAMSQNAWDDVDGAAWDDPDAVELLQESMGDPILPNVGTSVLAHARGAALVGAPLDDRLDDLEQTDGVVGRTGITQFWTPWDDEYDIHGFAAGGGAVGEAAREQIEAFLTAWRDGEPLPIEVPTECVDGACDFRE